MNELLSREEAARLTKEAKDRSLARLPPAAKTYNPGQVCFLFNFLKRAPAWFLLGGPGQGDEGQVIKVAFPDCKVIGWEPCPSLFEWQREGNFPDLLLPSALSDACGAADFVVTPDHPMCSTLRAGYRDGGTRQVEAMTLDAADALYGPFDNALLWLDIEGSEMAALRGAVKLFARRAIALVNVEVMLTEEETTGKEMAALMMAYGFEKLDHWDRESGNHIDVIWGLKE